MTNNDKLRRLRFALDISDREVIELFAKVDYKIDDLELAALFKKEDEPGFYECPDDVAALFLKGLVVARRGEREENAESGKRTDEGDAKLSNNDYLKAIRTALRLTDGDIVEILRAAGEEVSASSVNALFRRRGHSNYRPCGDQFLRRFLAGLTKRNRGNLPDPFASSS